MEQPHSAINIVRLAFCPLGSRMFGHTLGPFIAETHRAHCARNFVCASRVYRPRHAQYNAPNVLVKRALYCCSRCSDAASFLRPTPSSVSLPPFLYATNLSFLSFSFPLRDAFVCPLPISRRYTTWLLEDRTCATNYRWNYFWFRFQQKLAREIRLNRAKVGPFFITTKGILFLQSILVYGWGCARWCRIFSRFGSFSIGWTETVKIRRSTAWVALRNLRRSNT